MYLLSFVEPEVLAGGGRGAAPPCLGVRGAKLLEFFPRGIYVISHGSRVMAQLYIFLSCTCKFYSQIVKKSAVDVV